MDSSSNLWSSASAYATQTVYDWTSILSNWNNSLNMPPYVERILANLKEASNPDSDHNPPLSKFLAYLNHEQDGIKWFLYETMTLRWMWGDIRLDYVRDLVDEVEDLDSNFPSFPGSPGSSMSVREFVTSSLSEDELEFVQMMPPLRSHSQARALNENSVSSPPRTTRLSSLFTSLHNPPVSPVRRTAPLAAAAPLSSGATANPLIRRSSSAAAAAPVAERKPQMEFRLLRSGKGSLNDDVIKIVPAYDGCYNVIYNDQDARVKTKTSRLTKADVVSFLSNLFRFLTVDEEPFQSLQVTLPNLPTIMVTPKNLNSQTRDLVYDSVEMTINNWPVLV